MIDLKKFEKKKTTKPAGELTPNDVGSLVKVTDVNGVEITDILATFQAGDTYRNRAENDKSPTVSLSMRHVGSYQDRYDGGRGVIDTYLSMRVVVQRPIIEDQ